jgi:hypothetical protein
VSEDPAVNDQSEFATLAEVAAAVAGAGVTWRNNATTLASRAYSRADGTYLTATDDGTNINIEIATAMRGRLDRLVASRTTAAGASSTLLLTDSILRIDSTNVPHTTQLPSVAAANGQSFMLQRIDLFLTLLTLSLDPADTGARVYFQGNSPAAGASVALTGSDSGTRPAFFVHSDGTNWYVG